MKRKLIAGLACRNQGSRLYGKPLQNLDITDGVTILDNIIDCLKSIDCIDDIVLGIADGVENETFKIVAEKKGIKYIVGNEVDVLSRLIQCGELVEATDVFRVTSESPFLYYEVVEKYWREHTENGLDATFMDEIIDGCGFEIIQLKALQESHEKGEERHRSEFCSLYIRENNNEFNAKQMLPPEKLIRKDLRLTVDYPEDLVLCRAIYESFKESAPNVSVQEIVSFLDENPDLVKLIAPFTEAGYSTMNVWEDN